MIAPLNSNCTAALRLAIYLFSAITVVAIVWSLPKPHKVYGQDRGKEAAGPSGEPAPINTAPADAAPTDARPVVPPKDKSINIFELAVAGGIFMIPIAGMSILAVTMTIERLLALRSQRVLPDRLVAGL